MNKKKKLIILYGGKSVEHEISVRSALNIYEYADKTLFDITTIGISKTGSWFLTPSVQPNIEAGKEVAYSLQENKKGFVICKNSRLIAADIVFPVLHGTNGEDGSVQGLLKVMEIAFVGTGVLGSAIAMNKLVTKKILQSSGLPVGKFISFEGTEIAKYPDVVKKLGIPFMAKAASLGSSVGVFKVKNEADYHRATGEIFRYDKIAICEEFITGRELECSVMGNQQAKASKPAEIVVNPGYEFYTYEAKYLDPHAVQLMVPADVPEKIIDKVKQLSVKAFILLHNEDFARVDLFLTDDNQIIINEINTIPGFTNASMFPMMWQERGTPFTELITQLVQLAEQRHHELNKLQKSYEPTKS